MAKEDSANFILLMQLFTEFGRIYSVVKVIFAICLTNKEIKSTMTRIEQEKQTVEQMILLYCRRKEGNKQLCPECRKLLEYAHARLSRCPFGEKKSSCRLCTIHCYKPDMKEKMREVMRYAGPRMLFCHPVAALRHIWVEFIQR